MTKKYQYVFGIDPGTNTGICVYDYKKQTIINIFCTNIINAMNYIASYPSNNIFIIYEDARKAGRAMGSLATAQGAGSIKRDCKIWQEFCETYNISYINIPPQKGALKLSKEEFNTLYPEYSSFRTNKHSRDAAAMLLTYINKHSI